MTRYKATKLSVREDADNKKSNEDLEAVNSKLFENEAMISGLYAVVEGMTFEGSIMHFPDVGDSLHVHDLRNSLWTSTIKEITQEDDSNWIIKTKNSLYKLEKLGE